MCSLMQHSTLQLVCFVSLPPVRTISGQAVTRSMAVNKTLQVGISESL